jgi:hypothetical protein
VTEATPTVPGGVQAPGPPVSDAETLKALAAGQTTVDILGLRAKLPQ